MSLDKLLSSNFQFRDCTVEYFQPQCAQKSAPKPHEVPKTEEKMVLKGVGKLSSLCTVESDAMGCDKVHALFKQRNVFLSLIYQDGSALLQQKNTHTLLLT